MFTLKRESENVDGQFLEELLKLYRTIHRLASRGQLVDVGGYTCIGEPMLGRPEGIGILYSTPQTFEGVQVRDPSLTAVVVTRGELEVAIGTSSTRAMGATRDRLGRGQLAR